MGDLSINSVFVEPRTGSMEDIFTFTLNVSADTDELRLLDSEGKMIEYFNENNSVIRTGIGNTSQWIVQSYFYQPGNKRLSWMAVNEKREKSVIKEVAVTVNYRPLIYNIKLDYKSRSINQELKFYLTLDLWADGIRFIEDTGYSEKITLSDPRIRVLNDDSNRHQRTIIFRREILNIEEKVISFKALSGSKESPISCVKLYIPKRNPTGDRIEKLLTVARAEIGYKEREINFTKYGAWFGLNGQPWCAMFVSWVFAHSGNGNLFPRTASVYDGMNWFKTRRSWGNIPRVGAVVFFEFKDGFLHAGIVESINNNGTITVIEGNVNDQVMRRTHYINNIYNKRKILGYGYPKY